jgi:hypothetical protein
MGLVSGITAGRPLLSASILAVGVTALASVGFESSSNSFDRATLSYLASFACLIVAPAALAAVSPSRFWVRLLYGGFAAGVMLACRRFLVGIEVSALAPFDPGMVLAGAAALTLTLVAGIPLWRGPVRLALVGFTGAMLAMAGGFGFIAFETLRQGPIPLAAAQLALAGALSVVIIFRMAADFSRHFARGGGNPAAAGAAVDSAAVTIMFAVIASAMAFGALDIFSGDRPFLTAYAASVPTLLGPGVSAILLGAALSLKPHNERVAVEENRRRTGIEPFLRSLDQVLPPSSALAGAVIALILTVIAAFDLAAPISAAEIAFIVGATAFSALFLISLRSAMLMGLILVASNFLTAKGFELAFSTPSVEIRLVALVFFSIISFQLCISWRDSRDPRLKARNVTHRALGESFFIGLASVAIGASALLASQAGGVWASAASAAVYAGGLSLVGLAIAPVMMTAVGALFGRD